MLRRGGWVGYGLGEGVLDMKAIYQFFKDHAVVLGSVAALAAIITFVLEPVKELFPDDTPQQEQVQPPPEATKLTLDEFLRFRKALKEELIEELSQADDTEKATLRARIAELERQIANPDAELERMRKRNAELEALLQREGNEIGGDRIADATAALGRGDYSKADEIFAEIEARAEIEVQRAARAAFGRGEVAEAEVRWHDAHAHYHRAYNLGGDIEHLLALARMAWRLQTPDAERLAQQLADHMKAEHGADSKEYTTQLNYLGLIMKSKGRYEQAEELLKQALEIELNIIGDANPEYAKTLNNLAGVVWAQGRYEEAEGLYRQALEIDRKTIGDAHPSYATRLNNLAEVLRAQGRYGEAERLYGQALEIDRKTIGDAHPDYAIRLNNLALVVEAQGRYEEAERLYRKALKITRTTLGDAHPSYAIRLVNLGTLLGKMGRVVEGRGMVEEALRIFEAALPPDHPHIATAKGDLSALTE